MTPSILTADVEEEPEDQEQEQSDTQEARGEEGDEQQTSLNGLVEGNDELVSAQLVDYDREDALQAEIERLRRNIETATEVVADLAEDDEETGGAHVEQSVDMNSSPSRPVVRTLCLGFAAVVVLVGVILGLALTLEWKDRDSSSGLKGIEEPPAEGPSPEESLLISEEQQLAFQDSGLGNFTYYHLYGKRHALGNLVARGRDRF